MYFPIIDVLKENFIAKIPSIVTQWLTDNVDPVGSAVVVDTSLSISGAAADAKITGDELNDLKSDLNNVGYSMCGIVDLTDNEAKTRLPLLWEIGGINSSGAETTNTAFRRTKAIQIKQGQSVTVTVPEGLTANRYVYNLDGSFRSTTAIPATTTFPINSTLLFRFTVNAKSGYTLPNDVWNYLKIEQINRVAENNQALTDKVSTIGNGIDGSNEILRSAVKSINIYSMDNTKPVYFGLLRKNYNSSGKTVFNIYRDGVYSVFTLSETAGTHRYLLSDTSDLFTGNAVLDITIDLDSIPNAYDKTLNALTGLISADSVHEYDYPNIGDDLAIETYPYLGLLSEETIENTTITDLTDLSGKTCYLVGDSMTAAGTLDTYLNQSLGLVCTNYGVGGCTIAINDATMTGKSMVERVLGTGTSDNIVGSGDIWVIWGGYNDASYRNTPLGDINSNDNSTIYGALKTICKTIQEKTNNPRILLVTMHQSSNRMITAPNHDGKGVFIRNMREAFYQVGELFGIPVCDLYKIGGISPVNNLQMTSDGVHLNSYGKQFIYPKIANAIKEMV